MTKGRSEDSVRSGLLKAMKSSSTAKVWRCVHLTKPADHGDPKLWIPLKLPMSGSHPSTRKQFCLRPNESIREEISKHSVISNLSGEALCDWTEKPVLEIATATGRYVESGHDLRS